jgi:flagellar biosynthesis chaperone FliJ
MELMKEIDYLFEDPEIPNQRYALVSFVGPSLKQQCTVYGIKVRGVAESMEKAKTMSRRLHNIDPDFDIYTVDVGKFVPLDVDPLELKDIEYQNEELNKLVKGYLENRVAVTEEFEKRKAEMRRQAVIEGRKGLTSTEHPVSILNKIHDYENKIKQAQQNLIEWSKALDDSKMEFNKFTVNEQESAQEEFDKLLQESQSTSKN